MSVILFNVRPPPSAGTTSLYLQRYDEFNLEPADILLLGKIYDCVCKTFGVGCWHIKMSFSYFTHFVPSFML
jgi:hypothetical protein